MIQLEKRLEIAEKLLFFIFVDSRKALIWDLQTSAFFFVITEPNQTEIELITV